LPQDFQEFSRSNHSNPELCGTADIPNVVRYKIPSSRLSRQLNDGLVIRVARNGLPWRGRREPLGQETQTVEIKIRVAIRQTDGLGFPMRTFYRSSHNASTHLSMASS
jgi:hypothetical protein